MAEHPNKLYHAARTFTGGVYAPRDWEKEDWDIFGYICEVMSGNDEEASSILRSVTEAWSYYVGTNSY